MSETTKYFEQAIGRWLEQEKEKDEQFARQVETSGKTLEGCCNYIISQVKASKQCGYADEEIYGMARHFFDEADVKDPGAQSVSRIVVPGHINLTESEKAEEGEVMHHCVFANEYYKKEHSLILSARDSEGRRLETIEIDTRSWRVVQSRGLLNHPTERHDDIVALVERNMNKFKRAV